MTTFPPVSSIYRPFESTDGLWGDQQAPKSLLIHRAHLHACCRHAITSPPGTKHGSRSGGAPPRVPCENPPSRAFPDGRPGRRGGVLEAPRRSFPRVREVDTNSWAKPPGLGAVCKVRCSCSGVEGRSHASHTRIGCPKGLLNMVLDEQIGRHRHRRLSWPHPPSSQRWHHGETNAVSLDPDTICLSPFFKPMKTRLRREFIDIVSPSRRQQRAEEVTTLLSGFFTGACREALVGDD